VLEPYEPARACFCAMSLDSVFEEEMTLMAVSSSRMLPSDVDSTWGEGRWPVWGRVCGGGAAVVVMAAVVEGGVG
jgi:hypothetical protein